MRKFKQLLSGGKASEASSSKPASKSEDAQNGSVGSSGRKEDPKRHTSSKSSTSKEGTSSRRPSIMLERDKDQAGKDHSALVQEIERQAKALLPEPPKASVRQVGGGYLAPSHTRSQQKPSKLCYLPTIQSQDEIQASSSSASANNLVQFEEYPFLKSLETVFVIDDSASMAERWEDVSSALQVLVPTCAQYLYSGIEVGFPNRKGRFLHAKSAADVTTMFEDTKTKGPTPIGEMLAMILRGYLQRFEKWSSDEFKALNAVVITSGMPTDDSPYFELRKVIERNALKLKRLNASASQVGVHFFQVGQDAKAADFLQKLDDDCKNGKFARDIVDTKTFRTYDGILSPETVFGAIGDRLARTNKGKGKA